jgi:hypothetical protein
MTAVSIHREQEDTNTLRFRAVAGSHQSLGRTPGEALDALNAQLDPSESGSLIVVQQMQSDPYFSESQYLRMRNLLDRRASLTDLEREELEGLVKAELIASAKRTEALANALGR